MSGLSALLACGEPRTSVDASEPTTPLTDAAAEVEAGSRDASVAGPPKRIFAKRFVVHVRSSPSRDAERLGYLRGGAVLQATTAAPVGNDGCPGGWYELTTGGYVCNGADVAAFVGRRLPGARSVQPDLNAALPYEYGGVRRESPLYRRLPSDQEAAQYEGYVIPGTEPRPAAHEGEGAREPGESASAAPTNEIAAEPSPTAAPSPAPTPAVTQTPTNVASVVPGPDDVVEAPTLQNLMGERGSILIRRMMPGFILSLDKTYRIGSRRYWRSQSSGFAPYARIGKRTGSEFRGLELSEEASLPAMFVSARSAPLYVRDARGNFRGRGALRYHAKARVLGREQVANAPYLDIGEGRYVKASTVVLIEARPRPEGVGEDDQWIDVDLTSQSLVAYEGDRPVYVTLISSGRPESPSPRENFRTPTGTYRVIAKHLTTTMDADSASDGPYSIEDVPYVMYYHGGYALHTAFWHDRFGHPRSHGCVNLAPWDARHIFRWSQPTWHEGWHGVFTSASRPGTFVVVRGETPSSR